MPLVSVITPVLPAHSAWLTDTWHSLRQQEPEPDHPWDWEWLVQRDGPEPLQEPLPDDGRIRQQANPVARLLRDARRDFVSLAREYGLTPAAETRFPPEATEHGEEDAEEAALRAFCG